MRVEQRIAKEKEKMDKLLIKKEEMEKDLKKINKDIQIITDSINSLENEVKAENMREIEKVIGGTGINIQDILFALQNGDVLELQEKMENAKKTQEVSSDKEESDLSGNNFNN